MRKNWTRAAVALVALQCAPAQVLQVHGYVQGRFTDQGTAEDRLEIRRARVIASGDAFTRVSYRVQVDLAKEPYLMDAALVVHVSRWLAVTAGQMKIPFSAESIISDDQNPPISRSRAVLTLAPGRDTGVQGRDVGVQASGAIAHRNGPLVEYAVGVFRGQTFVHSPPVHYNAAAGRIVAHPLRGLSAGANWYGSFSAPPGMQKRREDLEGTYVRGRTTIRAEQIRARDGKLERRGGYVLGSWRPSPAWELLARTDWLNTDAHKPHRTSVAHITGANLTVWNHVKFGLNAGAQHDPEPKGWSSVLLAQMMTFF
jgi:phosphate-selective porin